MNTPRFSPTLVRVASQQVNSFSTNTPGVLRAVVTSSDGFEIASYQSDKTASAKIAAISSSLQALAEAMAAEGGFSSTQNVIVQTGSGVVLVMGISGSRLAMTLAVFAGPTAVLGHLLWAAKTCCQAIADAESVQN